jgi:hypothetical protein
MAAFSSVNAKDDKTFCKNRASLIKNITSSKKWADLIKNVTV